MYTHTCGDGGRHWYGKGEMCACGQVPNRLLASPSCDCGGSRIEPPVHARQCRAVVWANERNAWVDAHQIVRPSLSRVPERARSGVGFGRPVRRQPAALGTSGQLLAVARTVLDVSVGLARTWRLRAIHLSGTPNWCGLNVPESLARVFGADYQYDLLRCCLKQSSQYTGRSPLGRNGTSVFLPHSAQTTGCISRLIPPPPNPPPPPLSYP